MEKKKMFLPDRPIAFNRDFVSIGCGIKGALMLSQAVYWAKRTTSKDMSFYKTQAEWEEETGLTRHEQAGAQKTLQELGFIKVEKKGMPAKNYYFVQEEAIFEALLEIGSQSSEKRTTSHPKSGSQVDRKADDIPYTEITTETTSMGEGEGRGGEREITGAMVTDGIGLFRGVNPTFDTLYKNNTERGAMKRLLKRWDIEQLRLITEKVLPKVNANRYAKGKSITPLELERNMGYLKAYIDQHKSRTIKSV